jgi:hypothetical protein
MPPMTIRKSPMQALPFDEQSEYEQAYANHFKDQPVADGVRSIGAERHVERRQRDEQRSDLSDGVFDSLGDGLST